MRAWDVHTGKLVWTFHSVPRAGEKFNDTWAGDSWKNRSGVNVWGLMTVDVAARHRLHAVRRAGDGSLRRRSARATICSAPASSPPMRTTGKYLWHFQVVHHDIWDADVANPPMLLDVRQQGSARSRPSRVMSKSGLVFLLDRVTGKPIYGVEERPVPQSEVPLERTAKTQPFPAQAAAAVAHDDDGGGHRHRDAGAGSRVPEADGRACSSAVPYLPVGYNRLRVQFPGNHGGVNWGGASFNPQLGYLFVNTSELGQVQGFADREPAAGGAECGRTRPGRRGSNSPYGDVPGGGRFKDVSRT